MSDMQVMITAEMLTCPHQYTAFRPEAICHLHMHHQGQLIKTCAEFWLAKPVTVLQAHEITGLQSMNCRLQGRLTCAIAYICSHSPTHLHMYICHQCRARWSFSATRLELTTQ